MDSVSELRQLLSVESAAWATFLVVSLFALRMWNGAPAMFGKWIEWRRAKEEAKAADWARLRSEIARQGNRIEYLELRDQECQRNLAAAERRIAVLEGYLQGQGEARQDVTLLKSAERLIEEKKRD